jgi:EF hand
MFQKTRVAHLMSVIALFSSAVLVGQKAAPRKPPDTLALGEEDVKQLLLLLDADKNGKISKSEFMTFMEAEFDRLDVNKNGELDVKELRLSQLRSAPRSPIGK